jgi:nitrate/nitrite-specific signal transduction histidine kinase
MSQHPPTISKSSTAPRSACFLAFKLSPQATIILSSTGDIYHANTACTKLFVTPISQLYDTPLKNLVNHGLLPKELLHVCDKPQSISPIFSFKNRVGEKLWLRLYCTTSPKLKTDCIRIVHIENCTQTIQNEEFLSSLSQSIIAAHEDEKKMLSQEIHDTVCQSLAALKISIQSGANTSEIIHEVNRLIDDTRSLAHHLRPEIIDDLGITAALESLVSDLNHRYHKHIRFLSHTKHCQLTPIVSLQFYRIAQEALTNAIKHAQASKITVHLSKRKTFTTLTVTDNGKGFNLKTKPSTGKPHLGLKIMEERARRINTVLETHSVIGKGTVIKIIYPSKIKKSLLKNKKVV